MIATMLLAGWLMTGTPGCLVDAGGNAEPEGWGTPWYIGDEAIVIGNRRYVKYGLPRIVGLSELKLVGHYQAVPVLVDKFPSDGPLIYLLAHRDECSVQPYELEGLVPQPMRKAGHKRRGGRHRRK